MSYTIKQVAELSGISTRTLRYYDQIGLLKPAHINTSGYRIYQTKEIDQLQQILFYRSLSLKLEDIKKIISTSTYDPVITLENHYTQLLEKRAQLDQLLETLEKTLEYQKGERTMSNNEKFIGLKHEKLKENERHYGEEIRKKYGDECVDTFNDTWLKLTEGDFNTMEKTEAILFDALKTVVQANDIAIEEANTVFLTHKKWLMFTNPNYSKEFHLGLAQMYLADERFTEYYEKRAGKGATELLVQIIETFAQ